MRSLTTNAPGVSIPKQFCSLRGGSSLLEDASRRARSIASDQRICVAVTAQHQGWWRKPLSRLPVKNVVVQPNNCGTASGILLQLLQIVDSDPNATIALLPSDHNVDNEYILACALRKAIGALNLRPTHSLFLGIHLERADPELGYIVPGTLADDGTAAVLKFVEKPAVDAEQELLSHGALWNAFMIVSRAAILLKLFENNSPDLVSRMRQAFYTNPFQCMNDGGTIDVPYRTLPPLDFSRDILFSQESHLRVLRIPPCGWSDLGTPARVLAVPRRPFPIGSLAMNYPQKADILNLASFAFSRCRILAGARPAPVNGINEDLKI